jgi:UDP-N-acetylenolpyruvoylglucosamine reductase
MMCAVEAPPRKSDSLVQALASLVSGATILRENEPLARRTTLRVGGPADLFIEPANEADLAISLRFCAQKILPVFILGRGSNLLVRDGGFRGAVVCLSQPEFSRIQLAANRVTCGAGAKLKAVAVEARRHGLSGLEFLEGIPGTVGGALRMNAGAMGSATFETIESVRIMDFAGNVFERPNAELRVEYRCCQDLKQNLALSAVFRAQPASPELVERRMAEFSKKRWASQPAAPSAGCIFKNPETIPAGKLIDELGLKGTRVGGAMVSLEHGNFIVNDSQATAADVLELIEQIKARARAGRGIELRTEVEIIGE